jgi:predicted permease
MNTLLKDLKYGARMLVRAPAFTLVAILSLGLGIGANTAIFSLVNAVLLRPLPVEEPPSLVSLFTTDQRNPGNLPMSHLNYRDVRDHRQVFEDVAAFTFAQVNYNPGGEAEQILAQVVSGNYFSTLGVGMTIGRGFRAEEDAADGAGPVAVLSHGFWERSFGSDPGVLGRTVSLNRRPFTVIGVAPQGFTGVFLGGAPELWVPMSMHAVVQPNLPWYGERRGLFLFPFARLKDGVSLDQARAAMGAFFRQLEQEYPNDNKGRGAQVVPLLEARLNPNGQGLVFRLSAILMIVVGIILLIACANIANLLLARASKRRREIAVRLALGASRPRLVRQLLTESLLLSLAGGAAGLLLARWTLGVVTTMEMPLPFPAEGGLTLDTNVLIFALAVSGLTGLVFGLVPALQASKPDVVSVLKNEAPAGAGAARGLTVRKVLVVAQVSLSLVSLVAAGLFLRSLRHAQSVEPGFETESVLIMGFNLGREGFTPAQGKVFYERVTERAAALPGVRSATLAQNVPLSGGFLLRSVFPEGMDTTTGDRILVPVNSVGLSYFETLGIPLVAGRDFTRHDAEGAPLVVIVNQTMAERFWAGQDPLGKRFKFFGDEQYRQIVGVARNSKYNGLVEDPQPFVYLPLGQDYSGAVTLHVRAPGDAAALAGAARRAVQEIDPTLSIINVETLANQVEESLTQQRTNVAMLGIFGALALALAGIGLYGVASYTIAQRTREIGIRMALGAGRFDVLRLVLGQALIFVGVGVAIGLGAALAMSWFMGALVVGISAADPLTFASTAALLAVVAALASYVPARRATRIDPLIALRQE